MAINVYTPGCHLLCHDDVIGSRKVSYILYLTNPDDPWKQEWGGALRLYPTEVHSRPDGQTVRIPLAEHAVSIPPAFNQLSFFAVQPGESFHDVEEVFASQEDDSEVQDEVRDKAKDELKIEVQNEIKEEVQSEVKDKVQDEADKTKDEADKTKDGADKTKDEADKTKDENDKTKDNANEEIKNETQEGVIDKANEETKENIHDSTKDNTKDDTKENTEDVTKVDTKNGTNGKIEAQTNGGTQKTTKVKTKPEDRIRMAISGWYHVPQVGEDGFVEGLEEKLAEKSSLTQLQSRGDDFDLPTMKADTLNTSFNSSFSTDDSTKVPVISSREELFLTEEDLTFLVKYISPTYLTPDTLDSVSALFAEQCSLTLETFLSTKFSESLRDYITIQESQDLPALASEIETTTPWTVARPPHKHRFLFQHVREIHRRDPTSQSPLQDLLENLFPSASFRKWLEIATGETISSQSILARRFRRGKDYTLATGYNEEDTRLEITMAITPTLGWEPQDVDQRTKDNRERPSGLDVGGYVAYMAGDEEGDDECESLNQRSGGDEAKLSSTTNSAAELSRSSGPKSNNRPTTDPAVYQATGNDDDGVLFSMPASWNQLGIVLRDKGVMRFVKYVSRQAKGDRWDISGEFSVLDQEDEDVGVDAAALTDAAGVIDDTTEMEEVEEESSDDDWD